VSDWRSLLAEIAVPRRTGSAVHAGVREILRRELGARGLVVMEHAFRGRASPWLRGVRSEEIEGVNVVGVRPRARVTVWLVAHYDSKGQPLSMLGRLAALPVSLLLNQVTDRSPGAVDNATGVLTVFAILDQLPPEVPVGVVFSDAEEIGLVGARALVRDRPQLLHDTAVINFDGIDDMGTTFAFQHRPGPVGQGVALALGIAPRPWLPVVVDGIALRRAAGECLTLLRGDWRTMRVVHTPEDAPDRLTLTGVDRVASAVARAVSSVALGHVRS